MQNLQNAGGTVATVVRENHKWHIGSNPILTAMSKRYSESSNQDFKNDSAECLRREWDIMGTKESDTTPPSSVDFFKW